MLLDVQLLIMLITVLGSPPLVSYLAMKFFALMVALHSARY